MFWMVYVSSATQPFSKQELVGLLAKSREKNDRLGITGMLLYRGGNFMQVLEGDEATVRHLYETIGRDPRHHGLIVIDERESEERQFGDWSMGFRNLADKDVLAIPGFSPFMNVQLGADEFEADPGLCWGLLDLFRKRVI